MTSKLYPYTIKDTERTIFIKKVSPRLTQQITKLYQEPEPPTNTVTYPDGKTAEEPNRSDPAYEKQLNEYKIKLTNAVNELLVEQGVVVELSIDDLNEVKSLREFWKTQYGQVLEGSDKFIFINYICIGTPEDIKELITAITRRSYATVEGTQLALETFQSDV